MSITEQQEKEIRRETIKILINNEITIKEAWKKYRGNAKYGDFVEDYILKVLKGTTS